MPPPRRTLRHAVRGSFRISLQTEDGWTDLTQNLRVPKGVLDGFVSRHPEATTRQLGLLDDAFWQWVRVLGRVPTLVAQPSVAVASLWQVYSSDTRAYEKLPLHVRALTYVQVRGPEAMISALDPLQMTHAQAYVDEMPHDLPMLFRVDEELGIQGGRLYRTECTPQCADERSGQSQSPPERICLHGLPLRGLVMPLPSGG